MITDYAWDAPACSNARIQWEKAHAEPVSVTGIAQPPLPSVSLSNGPSSPPTQVDAKGLTFVTNGLAQPPANTQPVWLPKGTLFAVHTMQSASTYEALPYGKMRFELDQDVVVNGFLVAMKGDTAEGSFPTVQPARAFLWIPIRGSLFQVAVDTIYNFCGDKIDVDFDRTEYRTSHFFVGGNVDQHIIRGQEYVSFTSRPQRVCGIATRESNPPVPSAALYPTTH